MFENGMDSKAKIKTDLHQRAAAETGLDVNVIKDWIGNHRKVVSGRHYTYPTVVHNRGLTAFNVFVRENKDELGSMDTWAGRWNSLSSTDKETYRNKTKEINESIDTVDPLRTKRKLLKDIHDKLERLRGLGVDLVCFGLDDKGQQVVIGQGRVRKHNDEQTTILTQLYSYFSADVPAKTENIYMKDLRTRAQQHMNTLYNEATNTASGFNYNLVMSGQVEVNGFPDSVLPIRHMSHYGKKKLQDILSVSTIQIVKVVQNQTTSQTNENGLQNLLAVPEATGLEVHEDIIDPIVELISAEALGHMAEQVVDSHDTVVELEPEQLVTTAMIECLEKSQDMAGGKQLKKRKHPSAGQREGQKATNGRKQKKPLKDGTNEAMFYVERLLNTKTEGRKTLFEVKWIGYQETTWEPKNNLPKELVREFLSG